MVRPAHFIDVPRIQEIINTHAERGRMLFKNYAQLYENLRDFAVYATGDGESGGGGGDVVGCVALGIVWSDMAEIRSLAVDSDFFGRGIGRAMVEWCVDDARRLGVRKLMSLTYERQFFEKLGFGVVEKESLPLKVWSECVRCPKALACDEIAMVRELYDVPQIDAPVAIPTPRGVSIPVLPAEYD